MKKIKNGFTLIELLVVVAIIGILASVGIVSFQGYTKMAKNRVLVANWKTISKVDVSQDDILQGAFRYAGESTATAVAKKRSGSPIRRSVPPKRAKQYQTVLF